MCTYLNVWNVVLPLYKKVMFLSMAHILFTVQMALLATLIIITQRMKLSILSKMVQELGQFLMLLANVQQLEL